MTERIAEDHRSQNSEAEAVVVHHHDIARVREVRSMVTTRTRYSFGR